MTEDTIADRRLRKLLFRSRRRGMQEMDVLLGDFAERHLAGLQGAQVDRFEALLEQADNDLFNWITGKASPPEGLDHDVMHMIIRFRNSL